MLNRSQRVFSIFIAVAISILSLISSGICFAGDLNDCIVECGKVLMNTTECSYYELESALICDDDPAIEVGESVELNLNGFTVTSTTGRGILVNGPGAIVYNGKISGCKGEGMRVGGDNNTIEFLKFVNNGTTEKERGCYIRGDGNLFRYNFSYGNGDDALRMRDGRNEAEFNILGATISGEGIDIDQGEARNNFCFDNERGIKVGNSSVVERNIVISSNKDGIYVEKDKNKITANVVKHNGLKPGEENGEQNITAGIRVEGEKNMIKLNLATGNKLYDLYDMNEDCDRNKWRWNTGIGEPKCTKAPWWR
jgi:hypothetical protein